MAFVPWPYKRKSYGHANGRNSNSRTRKASNVRHNCMDTPKFIKELTQDIWDSIVFKPTKNDIESFENRLLQIDIKEFIIYNFINHSGTSLKDLLLSIFKFWNHLTVTDWKQIFNSLDKNDSAKYYMTVFANQYLGIDPNYTFPDRINLLFYTTDGLIQGSSPPLCVDRFQGKLRDIEEHDLSRNFGLCIDDFVLLHDRLNKK